MRTTLPIAGLLAVAWAGGAAGGAPPIRFNPVKVELPTGDRVFPGGDKARAINDDCLVCHSAGMVRNQPALSRMQWAAEVHKMIEVFKAPVPPGDVAAIIDYLAASKPGR